MEWEKEWRLVLQRRGTSCYYRTYKGKLEETKLEIEQFPGQILPVQMDVRNTDDIQKMIEQIDEKFGRIDILINNAAGNFICPAEDLSVNGWNSVINIVLNGTFYCSQAVGKYWIEKGIKGNIINMVATYAWDAGPGVIHSAAAKAGVLAMTKHSLLSGDVNMESELTLLRQDQLNVRAVLINYGFQKKWLSVRYKVFRLEDWVRQKKLQV